jgi:hypothetical protein
VNTATNTEPTSATQGVLAEGGQTLSGLSVNGGAQGGQSSVGIGNVRFSGGNGGTGLACAAGGGGAAGPGGAGGAGGNGSSTANTGRGGGGGAAGATEAGNAGGNGTNSSSGAGGAGGNMFGVGGGAAVSTNISGNNGILGGGGSGCFGISGSTIIGGLGSTGAIGSSSLTIWTQSSNGDFASPGGGGGGSSELGLYSQSITGANYGGGAGGGYYPQSGGQGLVIFKYLYQTGTNILISRLTTSGSYLSNVRFDETSSTVIFSVSTTTVYTGLFDEITFGTVRNLLTYTQQFDVSGGAPWVLAGCSVTPNTTTAPDGTLTADSVISTGLGTDPYLHQNVSVLAGVTYTVSVWVRGVGSTIGQTGFLWVWDSNLLGITGATYFGAGTYTLTNNWQRISTQFSVATSGIVLYRIDTVEGVGTTPGDVVYVWGAQTEVGSLTDYQAIGASGVVLSNFKMRQLNVIQPRRNLLRYTQQLDNAAWTLNNGTILANAIVDPVGNSTADLFIPNTSNTFHEPYQSPALGAGAYILSVYAKNGGYNAIKLRIDDSVAGQTASVIFDLTTGAASSVVNGGGIYATVTGNGDDAGNGWWRFRFAVTGLLSVANVVFSVYPTTAGTTYAGDGVSGVYIWGAQIELSVGGSSIPSDYQAIVNNYSTATITTQVAGIFDEVTGIS